MKSIYKNNLFFIGLIIVFISGCSAEDNPHAGNKTYQNGSEALFLKLKEDEVIDAKIIRDYISQGADVNYMAPDGTTVLNYGVFNFDSGVVETLLAAGADPNITAEKSSPLLDAVFLGKIDTVQLLLKYGADINYQYKGTGNTPLMIAVLINHNDLVQNLIDNGADVNIAIKEEGKEKGFTALTYAKRNNNQEIIDMLIKAGAKE